MPLFFIAAITLISYADAIFAIAPFDRRRCRQRHFAFRFLILLLFAMLYAAAIISLILAAFRYAIFAIRCHYCAHYASPTFIITLTLFFRFRFRQAAMLIYAIAHFRHAIFFERRRHYAAAFAIDYAAAAFSPHYVIIFASHFIYAFCFSLRRLAYAIFDLSFSCRRFQLR